MVGIAYVMLHLYMLVLRVWLCHTPFMHLQRVMLIYTFIACFFSCISNYQTGISNREYCWEVFWVPSCYLHNMTSEVWGFYFGVHWRCSQCFWYMTFPSDDLSNTAWYHTKEHTSLVTFLYSVKFLLDNSTVQTNSSVCIRYSADQWQCVHMVLCRPTAMCVYGTVQTNSSMCILVLCRPTVVCIYSTVQTNSSVYIRYSADQW